MLEWAVLFRDACEKDESLDWKNAGFVRCDPDDVRHVQDRLFAICDETNDRYRQFLEYERSRDPDATDALIEREQMVAAEEAHDKAFRLRSR